MIPAASAARKYRRVGIMTMAVSGVSAIYLSIDGNKCPSALNSTSKAVHPRSVLEEAGRFCFFMTNSYVYTLFGVVTGIALLSLSASKCTKNSRSQ
ncbi:MAG TPA: hypothetical protein VGQ03_08185 [Nitrososphaera sp.]|nr:hypothetical protein [Nitrososphaera sp.]